MKTKTKRLTPIERKCLRKFYLDDSHLLFEHGPEGFRKLGLERAMEMVFKLAEEEPTVIEVIAKDINNFMIMFDRNLDGEYEPVYIMKNGEKEF